MAIGKDTDIERLAAKVGVNGLYYENISEREEQLQRLERWPMFKEIIVAIDRASTSNDKQRPDYLKITR
jgi:hypothetical protein